MKKKRKNIYQEVLQEMKSRTVRNSTKAHVLTTGFIATHLYTLYTFLHQNIFWIKMSFTVAKSISRRKACRESVVKGILNPSTFVCKP